MPPPGRQQFGSPNLHYLVFFVDNQNFEIKPYDFQNRSSGWSFAASVLSRLSHFVAPLYVAPSPTPGNAKPTSEFYVAVFLCLDYAVRCFCVILVRVSCLFMYYRFSLRCVLFTFQLDVVDVNDDIEVRIVIDADVNANIDVDVDQRWRQRRRRRWH